MSRCLVLLRSRRVLVPLAVLVVLASVAVTVVGIRGRDVHGHAEPNDSTATARFGQAGVDLSLGGLTVRGPAGAAPDGTVLTASTTLRQPPANLAAYVTGIGGGVSLSLGGREPVQPMRLTFRTTAAPPPGAAAVLITVPSDGSQPRLIPASYSAATRTITASVDHFSWFWPAFLSFGSLTKKVIAFLAQTAGLSAARPACAGRSASANGVTVTLPGDYGSNARPAAWPCVTVDGSTVSVELTSDSPLPWRVRAAPDATLRPEGATDPGSVVLLAAYQTLVTKHPFAEGLLIPSETMTYTFDADSLPGTVQGRVDVGTWLGMDLLFAFTEAIDAFGINLNGIPEDADAIGCLGNAVTAASLGTTPSVAAMAGLAKAVLSCLGPVARAAGGSAGVAGAVIGLLTGGVTLIAGGIEGAVRSATGTDAFTISVGTDIPPTKIEQVRPTDHGNHVKPGFTIDKTITASGQDFDPSGCEAGSDVVGAVYRCFGTDNGVYDPCWPDDDDPTTPSAVCWLQPWSTHLVRMTLAQPLDPPGDTASNPRTDEPWAVQLTNGAHCEQVQGTHDTFDGQPVDYYCDDNATALLRGPHRSSGRWTMPSAHTDANFHYSTGPKVALRTVWYGLPTP